MFPFFFLTSNSKPMNSWRKSHILGCSQKKNPLVVRFLNPFLISVRVRIVSISWDQKLSGFWTLVRTIQGQWITQFSSFFRAETELHIQDINHSPLCIIRQSRHLWSTDKTVLTTGLWIIHVLAAVETMKVQEKKKQLIKYLRWNSKDKVLHLKRHWFRDLAQQIISFFKVIQNYSTEHFSSDVGYGLLKQLFSLSSYGCNTLRFHVLE